MYVVWTSTRTAGIWSPWYERCTRPLARFWWHRVRVECEGNRCYTGVAKVDHGTQTHQPRGRLETFRVAWQVKLDWLGWLDFGNLGGHVIHSWGLSFHDVSSPFLLHNLWPKVVQDQVGSLAEAFPRLAGKAKWVPYQDAKESGWESVSWLAVDRRSFGRWAVDLGRSRSMNSFTWRIASQIGCVGCCVFNQECNSSVRMEGHLM